MFLAYDVCDVWLLDGDRRTNENLLSILYTYILKSVMNYGLLYKFEVHSAT